MITIQFKYRIGDEIKIIDIETEGRIASQLNDINGKQYKVIYWNDGLRKEEWMYDWELK